MSAFHLLSITNHRYKAVGQINANSLEAAQREALRTHLSERKLRIGSASTVLRDGYTGKRYSMRECADTIPGLPWYWWCSDEGAARSALDFIVRSDCLSRIGGDV